jgi:hypothetical protein
MELVGRNWLALTDRKGISAFGSVASRRRNPDSNDVGNMAYWFGGRRRALRFLLGFEDTMLHTLRPTPTCTRFQATIEMPCIKCAEPMRLVLIEPRRRPFDLLTYHCDHCDSEESFLTAR